MTQQEFLRIYEYLKGKYGIDMEHKRDIVQGRLENYVRINGFESFGKFMDAVLEDYTGQRERDLVNMLTTNHTFFMREFEHFEFLRQVVLPKLRTSEAKKKDLRIWCGAASTGQEPYMLAMLMTDFFGLDHPNWDTKILATDIATEALSHAIKGRYDREQIECLPENWRRRFLHRVDVEGNIFEITEELKKEVIFRQFNLMDVFPFRKKMHIVFLRNVMIYFDKETKNQLLKKVYDIMEPGGYLFVGQTETIDRTEVPFKLVKPSIFIK